MNKIVIAIFFISVYGTLLAQNQNNRKEQDKKQTAGRDILCSFAPKFATLIGSGTPEFTLKAHLQKGRENGISKDEIAEIITHIAFYAGWPKAWGAFNAAKEVYAEEITKDSSGGNAGYIFGIGNFNEAYKAYFTGKSYLNSTFASISYQALCTNNEIFSCFAGTHPAQPCVKKEKLSERKRVLFFQQASGRRVAKAAGIKC